MNRAAQILSVLLIALLIGFSLTQEVFAKEDGAKQSIWDWIVWLVQYSIDEHAVFHNVVEYGADPTNTVDSSGAIQNAIDAAIAEGGGIVFFPAGHYRISDQGGGHALYWNANSVHLMGVGGPEVAPQGFPFITGSVLNYTSTTGSAIRIGDGGGTSRYGNIIEGLAICGTEQAGNGIFLNRANQVTIVRSACISNFQVGLLLENLSLVNHFEDVVIRDCATGLEAITSGTANSNSFYHVYFRLNTVGARVARGTNVRFTDCQFELNSSEGLLFAGGVRQAKVDGCRFESNNSGSGSQLLIDDTLGSANEGVVVMDNYFTGNDVVPTAIKIDGLAQNVSLAFNHFERHTTTAIDIAAATVDHTHILAPDWTREATKIADSGSNTIVMEEGALTGLSYLGIATGTAQTAFRLERTGEAAPAKWDFTLSGGSFNIVDSLSEPVLESNFVIQRDSDAQIYIDNNHNIGINTGEGAAARLHVVNTGLGDSFKIDDGVHDETPFVIDGEGNVGIGTSEPAEKLDVEGYVEAHGYLTGDIIFRKNEVNLWRMFEDEEGLYVEDLRTKETSRVLFGKDLSALESKIEEQQRLIRTLADRVKKLEERVR